MASSISSAAHNRKSLPGFRRVSHAGRRAGTSTPLIGWKMCDNSAVDDGVAEVGAHRFQAGKRISVSVRKLAASLWELQGTSWSSGAAANTHRRAGRQQTNLSSYSAAPLGNLPQNPYPATGHANRRLVSRFSNHCKFGGTRRHSQSSRQARGTQSQALRSLKWQTGANNGHVTSDSHYSPHETEAGNRVISPTNSVPDVRTIHWDDRYGPRTSGERLKALKGMWSPEQQHTSSTSMVSTLCGDLDNARAQVQALLHGQMLYRKEIEHLTKTLADEKVIWQEQQQEAVRVAVQTIKAQLEDEKIMKRGLKMLQRKISRELADSKVTLAKALQECERERKARELMQDVCDELAREIHDYKAKVEDLKCESANGKEWAEKECMLQLSVVWKQERAKMKQMEMTLESEDKSATLDRFLRELEAFLITKRACDARDKGSHHTGKEIGKCRSLVDLGETRIEDESSIDPAQFRKARIPGQVLHDSSHVSGTTAGIQSLQNCDDDCRDNNPCLIEFTTDSIAGNVGSPLWGYLQKEVDNKGRSAHLGVLNTDLVNDKGRQRQGRKSWELERTTSIPHDVRIVTLDRKNKGKQLDYANDSQWVDRISEKGELRNWKHGEWFSTDAKEDATGLLQVCHEELKDQTVIGAKALERNLYGPLACGESFPVEGTSSRPEAHIQTSVYEDTSALRFQTPGTFRELHAGSRFSPVQFHFNVGSSPTHRHTQSMSFPESKIPYLGSATEVSTDMKKRVRDNSLKAKLLEAKLEGQQSQM